MRVTIGTKVTNPMPGGLRWPSIAITDEVAEKRTVINKSTGLPVEIVVTTADFLSQRTARDGTVYPAITTEVVQFGYRPVAMPRFSNIVGLDVTEEGALIDLQSAIEAHEESFSKWQAANFEARRGATSAADL